MATVNEKMTAIADAIRDKTGGTEMLTLDDMANSVNEVYDNGYSQRNKDLWKTLIDGKGKYYPNYFFSKMTEEWNVQYDGELPFTSGEYLFAACAVEDLEKTLKDWNLKLKFDNGTTSGNYTRAFASTKCRILPEIHLRAHTVSYLFYNNTKLETIRKVTIFGNPDLSNAFNYCPKLTNIKFGSNIGKNISLSSSPLSVESMKDTILHLTNYAGTTSEFTYKITFSSACKTALEAEGNTSPNGNTWIQYLDDIGWLY